VVISLGHDCPTCHQDAEKKAVRELFTELGYDVSTDKKLLDTLDLFWCDED
jgi:hypothetical protein